MEYNSITLKCEFLLCSGNILKMMMVNHDKTTSDKNEPQRSAVTMTLWSGVLVLKELSLWTT